MFLEIANGAQKARNILINFRHYAIVDRYSFFGPCYVDDVVIYVFLFTCNFVLMSIDLQLAFEEREYSRATLGVAAMNAGYLAMINAAVAYLIVLCDTKILKNIHKVFGISTIALCTFHSSVKLMHHPSMSAHQEIHTTIVIARLLTLI